MDESGTARARMIAGELYLASDLQLTSERKRAKALCARYNASPSELDRRLLAELFGDETDAHLEPPFYCDYGYNIRLGQGVYANHNLVILDCAPVSIGDQVLIGPNVVLSTATHPTDAALRATGAEYALPIRIWDRAWIGASVTLLPGVEIGENSTIGAGSVVTKSVPANCIAVGNPCRVVREIR